MTKGSTSAICMELGCIVKEISRQVKVLKLIPRSCTVESGLLIADSEQSHAGTAGLEEN